MNPSLFIHYSSFSSFNHHHQTKNHHEQTCNRATLKCNWLHFLLKKIVVQMKNVKFRGKKTNSAAQIPRLKPKLLGSKFHGPRKTVGLIITRGISVYLLC